MRFGTRIARRMEQIVDTMSAEELGYEFKWYVKESNHNSWDGWPKRDLRGALALLRDFMLCLEMRDK